MDKLVHYQEQIPGFCLDAVFVGGMYDPSMKRKIHRFKFVHNRVDRVEFQRAFAQLYKQNPRDFDIIVYPPVSKKDRIFRGPNHAKVLAHCFPNPHHVSILCPFEKTFFAGHQSQRSKTERAKIAEEFLLREKYASLIKGKRILLVDDLITTGYTAHTLGNLLKDAGAESVVGYFLASEKIA